MRLCVFDQDPPHQLGGNAAEMRAVFPLRAILTHELHVCFVHKRSGLKRVIAALKTQTIRSPSAKLFVDQRHEPGWRLCITLIPVAQNLGDVGLFRGHHAVSSNMQTRFWFLHSIRRQQSPRKSSRTPF